MDLMWYVFLSLSSLALSLTWTGCGTGIKITLPALTEKDKGDLIFGCQQGVDFVAASFIRKAEDIVNIRNVCQPRHIPSFQYSLPNHVYCTLAHTHTSHRTLTRTHRRHTARTHTDAAPVCSTCSSHK